LTTVKAAERNPVFNGLSPLPARPHEREMWMPKSNDVVIEQVRVREAAGVFHSRESLDAAVDDLLLAGFDRADIDLMAGVDAVRDRLDGVYAPVEELADVPGTPRRAYVAREDVFLPLATAGGILTFIGAAGAAAGVVASGGAVALAAAAAIAGGAAGGGLSAVLVRLLGRRQAGALEGQLASGGLVLWVRLHAPEQEERALRILRRHGAEAVRVHEIPLDKRLKDIPLSSLRIDPWLGEERLGQP
jgi:hypothetical protein